MRFVALGDSTTLGWGVATAVTEWRGTTGRPSPNSTRPGSPTSRWSATPPAGPDPTAREGPCAAPAQPRRTVVCSAGSERISASVKRSGTQRLRENSSVWSVWCGEPAFADSE